MASSRLTSRWSSAPQGQPTAAQGEHRQEAGDAQGAVAQGSPGLHGAACAGADRNIIAPQAARPVIRSFFMSVPRLVGDRGTVRALVHRGRHRTDVPPVAESVQATRHVVRLGQVGRRVDRPLTLARILR